MQKESFSLEDKLIVSCQMLLTVLEKETLEKKVY
ncbi:hypothetical protein FHU24_004562 [Clostridium saccharobutylicum]|nr:hypothetical protein [Clostridium saccharobutylicum]